MKTEKSPEEKHELLLILKSEKISIQYHTAVSY